MTLNFHRIEANKHAAELSLSKKNSTYDPTLATLSNFFQQNFIDDLIKFLEEFKDWKKTNNLFRFQLTWESNTIIEEAHIIFEELTITVEKFVNRKLKFNGLCIWKDFENYAIPTHSDNPKIEVALQIYLQGPRSSGTEFIVNGTTLKLDFTANSGYIMDNRSQLLHKMINPLKKDEIRYTIYASWCSA